MSNLISKQQAASRGSQTSSQGGYVAATSTPDMATTGVHPVALLGPTVSTAAMSSTSSVTHLVLSAQRTHRRPQTSEEAQPPGDASSVHGKGSRQDLSCKEKKNRTSGILSNKFAYAYQVTLEASCEHLRMN